MNKKGTGRASISYLKRYQKQTQNVLNKSMENISSLTRVNSARKSLNMESGLKTQSSMSTANTSRVSTQSSKVKVSMKPQVKASKERVQQFSVLNKMLKPSKISPIKNQEPIVSNGTPNPEQKTQNNKQKDELGYYQESYYRKRGIKYSSLLQKKKKSLNRDVDSLIKDSVKRVKIVKEEKKTPPKMPMMQTVKQLFKMGNSKVHPIVEESVEEDVESEPQKIEKEVEQQKTFFPDIIPLQEVDLQYLEIQCFSYENISHPELRFEYKYEKKQEQNKLKEGQAQDEEISLQLSVEEQEQNPNNTTQIKVQQTAIQTEPQIVQTSEEIQHPLQEQQCSKILLQEQIIQEPLQLKHETSQYQQQLDYDEGQSRSFIVDDQGNLIERIEVEIKDFGVCHMMTVYEEGQQQYMKEHEKNNKKQ